MHGGSDFHFGLEGYYSTGRYLSKVDASRGLGSEGGLSLSADDLVSCLTAVQRGNSIASNLACSQCGQILHTTGICRRRRSLGTKQCHTMSSYQSAHTLSAIRAGGLGRSRTWRFTIFAVQCRRSSLCMCPFFWHEHDVRPRNENTVGKLSE